MRSSSMAASAGRKPAFIDPSWMVGSEYTKDLSVQWLLLKLAELIGGVGIVHKAKKAVNNEN